MKCTFLTMGCVLLAALTAAGAEDLPSLLSRFQSERTVAAKEAIITEIAQHHREAGQQLLEVARQTGDVNTKFLAIRGIGYLKYQPATQFLVDSLRNPDHYIRANAARALGELKAYSTKAELIALLKTEQDNGVIEQTSLALKMLKAAEAEPILQARADNVSNIQTECWLIDALAVLGSRKSVPFIAKRLYGDDQVVAICAATDLQQITGEDLQLGMHPGPIDSSAIISKARVWWEENASNWK